METLISDVKTSRPTALLAIIDRSALTRTRRDAIIERFQDLHRLAEEWTAIARSIKVQSEHDNETISKAREMRLAVRVKRIEIEHVRKELKESSLREGQAIDAVANYLTEMISPIEKYLDEQEKYPVILMAKRKAELRSRRVELLQPFVPDLSFYDLGAMPEDQFQTLLQSSKDAKAAAMMRAESERIEREAAEKAEAEEKERLRAENEKLREEREIRNKAFLDEEQRLKDKADAERKKLEQKLKAEREEKQRIANELAAKEAEEKEKERLRVQAARKAAKAPDESKLLMLSENLYDFNLPLCKDSDCRNEVVYIRKQLNILAKHIADFLK